PKALANNIIRINDYINTMCIAKTNVTQEFELITGDQKGVLRINGRFGKPFFTKDVKDGIRLPSSILCATPGDLNGNKLSEIVVGCMNGEIVMVERVPGKKYNWDRIRGFSLGQIFQSEVKHILTGDFNGNNQIGFIAGSRQGLFKEVEFRPQLQKFDLISEFKVESEPSFCFSGDFDRDGITEVMIGETSGKLSIFKRSRLMSVHNLDGIITCGTVGDVDNDRQLEIVVGTSNGSFHILRQNTIESYEGYGNIGDLKVGDLSGNRMNDLVFSIDKRRVIAFSLTRDKIKEKPNADLIPYGPPGVPGGIRRQVPTSQLDTKEIFCPNCQSEVKFIEEYRRWYCYSCRQYVAPVDKNAKQKTQTSIAPQKHGSPYDSVGSPYSPYQTQSTPYKVESETPISEPKIDRPLPDIEAPDSFDFHEEKSPVISPEAEYFLPLDLEADLDTGSAYFNDILKIRHVILIHSHSGVPLFSQSFGKDIDVSLTSGFLSAVGTFTEEMSGETEKRFGVFSEIGREGFWISIYEGHHAKTALLISEKISDLLKKRIAIFMKEFEQKYAEELEGFAGFVSAFSNTTELLEKHLRIEYLYPLKVDVKRMRLTAITPTEKKIAKIYTEFIENSEEEVYFVTELINILYNQNDLGVAKEDSLKVLIKYLENGMLIPLPPPPEEIF
ncbi:MAG: FG-GAP repeat domain-containing protein, partial [Candidatus Thorarchaeota archaeon]